MLLSKKKTSRTLYSHHYKIKTGAVQFSAPYTEVAVVVDSKDQSLFTS